MKAGEAISIWFFIGLSLLVNGVLILGAGVFEIWRPPAQHVTLWQLHANLWWGGVLFLVGVAYCLYFAPGKQRG